MITFNYRSPDNVVGMLVKDGAPGLEKLIGEALEYYRKAAEIPERQEAQLRLGFEGFLEQARAGANPWQTMWVVCQPVPRFGYAGAFFVSAGEQLGPDDNTEKWLQDGAKQKFVTRRDTQEVETPIGTATRDLMVFSFDDPGSEKRGFFRKREVQMFVQLGYLWELDDPSGPRQWLEIFCPANLGIRSLDALHANVDAFAQAVTVNYE
jgi:hypothetical protein